MDGFNQNNSWSNAQISESYNRGFMRRIFNPSTVLGILSALFLLLGILLPMLDFAVFNENIDIKYNLIKICKNIGLISAPWKGIPYGIIIGIVGMFILSFVRIPILKLIPSLLVIAMVAIMLIDMGNIINWISDILDRYYSDGKIVVDTARVFRGLLCGAYFLASGIIMGIISCFLKAE